MEIVKPNDIFVASLNNPEATTYDLMSMGLLPENTSLFSKEEYKQSDFVQEKFKDKEGKFDDIAFNNAYNKVANSYFEMSSDEYLDDLDKIEYSPFDITRPKNAETFSVNFELAKDYNPFKQLYSRTGFNSIDDSDLSMRELAQQGKIFDPETKTWSEESANELNLLDKFFGETLVYAQWDEDGVHSDKESGRVVEHKKGDWKVNDEGNLFLEKLAGREIYGKQVVNPMDMLTTDGSIANKFDFMDSDSREKSLPGIAFKLAAEIAPVLIPGAGVVYGGVRAAIGLASVMPTFYKSLESLLLGDRKSSITDSATQLEGWMAKFTQTSSSDEGSNSMFSAEQMANMVGDIFTQIYEQRAVASLSKILVRKDRAIDEASKRIMKKINGDLLEDVKLGKINPEDFLSLSRNAASKIPELQSLIKKQSQVSKALSLGYMALTSTADVYGDAINSGYDRRTAGFAALAAASGQYGIMMNNRMGDWFLDKTTGYSNEVNKSLLKSTIKPYLDEANKIFSEFHKSPAVSKAKLAGVFGKMKKGMDDLFMGSPASITEAMWKNAVVEGVEEVTEEAVMDMTKGVIDTMSYLGLTKKQGSFNTIDKITSKEGLQKYLANFLGGVLGGGMFEFERSVYTPWVTNGKITPEVRKSLYEVLAAGQGNELRNLVKKEASYYGMKNLSSVDQDGNFMQAKPGDLSQADLISNKVLEVIDTVEGILHENDLIHSDEDIIKKAIRDEITIENLKKTVPKDGSIGLEGIILQDFKNHMMKIVDLQGTIKQIASDDTKKQENETLKTALKTSVDAVNEILSGERSMKYFDQISVYLNNKINESFVVLDKDTYTKKKYGVNFSSLPETGIGLSKEIVTKEWLDSVDKRDLIKELEYATAAYRGIEELTNKPIADYVESEYDIEFKKTTENIIDLKQTIDNFNTATTPDEKNKTIERVIQIGNYLESLTKTRVAYFESYHNDMYEQLKSLGLIKKVTHQVNSNNELIEKVEDFDEGFLKSNRKNKNVTNEDYSKEIVQEHFKKFPANPLIAEEIIKSFNEGVAKQNHETINKIFELENSPNKDENTIQQIELLKEKIINVKISPIENAEEIQNVLKESSESLEAYKVNNQIEDKDLKLFERVNENPSTYEKSFDEILKDVAEVEKVELSEQETLIEDLSLPIIKGLFTTFIQNGAIAQLYTKFEGDEKSLEKLDYIIGKINSVNIEQDLLDSDKELVKTFIGNIKEDINSGNNIKNNEKIINAVEFVNNKKEETIKTVDKLKPEIFKIHNYALDFLLKKIEEGSKDKEVFNIAKQYFDEEISNLKTSVFGEIKNLSNEDFLKVIENKEIYFKGIENFHNELENEENTEAKLSDVININDRNSLEDWQIFLIDTFDTDISFQKAYEYFFYLNQNIEKNKESFKRINKFLEIKNKNISFKNNPLYDFIRNFTVSLNSDPSGRLMKLIDIIEREDISLKASSNITNYTADDIREQDVNQALATLNMIKSAIYAMSTTQVGYTDPVGFIKARQDFAKKNKIKDDVINLKTITSDVATLMIQDVDRIANKLNFLKDLGKYNAGRRDVEEQLIRDKMSIILTKEWENIISKINPSFIPLEEIKKILSSNDDYHKKLLNIENSVYEFAKSKDKKEIFTEFRKFLEGIDPEKYSKIDKEIKEGGLTTYDLVIYFGTILTTKSSDFYSRELETFSDTFNKSPFFTQEYASRVVVASTMNPDLFNEIYTTSINENENAGYITSIYGKAGAGKTSTVVGTALDILRQTNDNTNVWLSAPDIDQAKRLETGITGTIGSNKLSIDTFNKNTLYEKLGIKNIINSIELELGDFNNPKNKYIYQDKESEFIMFNHESLQELEILDFENLPNILVFDEASHLSFAEVLVLNKISQISYNDENRNFMKVVMALDPSQMGYRVTLGTTEKPQYLEYNITSTNTINTPRLKMSVRSANIQQKTLVDTMDGIVEKVTEIFSEKRLTSQEKNDKAFKFLKDVNTITGLPNYSSNTEIYGAFIRKNYDKKLLKVIADKIIADKDVKIGILTTNKELDEELTKIFTDLKLIDANGNHPNITLFTEGNIQGGEADYFIFDSKFVTKFNTIRDKIKSFHTYMSRAKHAAIIIDSNGDLKTQLDIENAAPSMYPLVYDPFTKTSIEQAKQKRKEQIQELIGKDYKITEDFKWVIGKDTQINEEKSVDSVHVYTGTNEKVNTFIKKESEDFKKVEDKAIEQIKDGLDSKEFKYMLHSFYNNPNADINKERTSLIRKNNLNTDLNLNRDIYEDVNSKEEIKNIINSWTSLKNYLIHNYPSDTKEIDSGNFLTYLKEVFEGLESGDKIGVELLLTLTSFDPEIHSSFSKEGNIDENKLAKGDPFINLSVKLTRKDGAVHYVTLASFAKEETLNAAIDRLASTESKQELKNSVAKKFSQIKELLNKKSDSIITISKINPESIEFLTSTRLLRIKKQDGDKFITTKIKKEGGKETVSENIKIYTLDEIETTFPGMKISPIRLFPGEANSFRNLVDKYTFGEKRSEDAIFGTINEETKERTGGLYEMLKNKPYVVVSYTDDLDGINNGKTTKSRFVAIQASSRGLDVLKQEVKTLRQEYSKTIHEFSQSGKSKESLGTSEEMAMLSAKAESLLSRSDILDILITWAKDTGNKGKPFIDLLTEKIKVKSIDGQTEKEYAVLDIFNNFRGVNDKTRNALLQVIEKVKEVVKNEKDPNKIKKGIIDKISGITGWHWDFYNIFDYDTIITSEQDREQAKAYYEGTADFSAVVSVGYPILSEIAKDLLITLQNNNFYYSIPIKPNGEVNTYISGKNGFSNDFFANKFFISVAPESERLLVNLTDFFNSETLEVLEIPSIKEESIEEKFLKEFQILEEITKNINSTDEDAIKSLIKQIETLQSKYPGKGKVELSQKLEDWKNVLINLQNQVKPDFDKFIERTTIEKDGNKISVFEKLPELTKLVPNIDFTEVINDLEFNGDPISYIESFFGEGGKNKKGLNVKMSGSILTEEDLAEFLLSKSISKEEFMNLEGAVEEYIYDIAEDIITKLNKCRT